MCEQSRKAQGGKANKSMNDDLTYYLQQLSTRACLPTCPACLSINAFYQFTTQIWFHR